MPYAPTARQVEDFARDGVICLRRAIPSHLVDLLAQGIDECLASPGPKGRNFNSDGSPGRFAGDVFMWTFNEKIRRFVRECPLGEIAAAFMDSREVRLMLDQMFVKEPGAVAPTPWHQDLPYWPLRGNQICGLWCPLDPVDLDSGAVEYVRGSHLAGRWYRPRHFGGASGYDGASGDPMPDIDATVAARDRLSWAMEPGDAIAFHGLVVHGAGGNRSAQRRRRAVSLRWMGDDAVFDDRPGTYPFEVAGQIPGSPLQGKLYPQVWPRPLQAIAR